VALSRGYAAFFSSWTTLFDRGLRVAEEHPRLRVEVQLVVDAGEPGAHGALDHHDVLRVVPLRIGMP